MRRMGLLCVIGLLAVATCAAANPTKGPWGPLIPCPDPARYYSFICDRTPGLLQIYVVYYWMSGVTAVQFSAPKPACFTGTWLGDTQVYPVTIGNSQIGVSVGFGACRQPPVHVLTMMFFAYGTTPADCIYRTVADPSSYSVLMVDCNDQLLSIPDGGNYINPPEGACGPTPVEKTTWGKVKSLFSE